MPKGRIIKPDEGLKTFDLALIKQIIDKPETNNQKGEAAPAMQALESVIAYDLFDNSREETRYRAALYLIRQKERAEIETPDKSDLDIIQEFLALENIFSSLKNNGLMHFSFDETGSIRLFVNQKVLKDNVTGDAEIELDAQKFSENILDLLRNPQFIGDLLTTDRERPNVTPTTIYPKQYIMPLAKVVTELASVNAPVTKDLTQAEKINVGKAVSVYVQLGFTPETARENGIEIPERIVDFDLQVLNAIITLLKAGNTVFWPEQILSVLKGKTSNENKHEGEIERVISAVEKLRFTPVYIDATEQFAQQKKYKIDASKVIDRHVIYDENILFLRGARAISLNNGKTVTAWEYASNKMPILYTYSEQLNQVTSVNIRLLDTGTRNDETSILAKTYMLREIAKMKSKTRNSRKMLYVTIYKACGIDKNDSEDAKAKEANKKRRNRYKSYIKQFCDSWTEQGFITGYIAHDDGITIELND